MGFEEQAPSAHDPSHSSTSVSPSYDGTIRVFRRKLPWKLGHRRLSWPGALRMRGGGAPPVGMGAGAQISRNAGLGGRLEGRRKHVGTSSAAAAKPR